jgi:hypothetical protein
VVSLKSQAIDCPTSGAKFGQSQDKNTKNPQLFNTLMTVMADRFFRFSIYYCSLRTHYATLFTIAFISDISADLDPHQTNTTLRAVVDGSSSTELPCLMYI